jgi:hypothetical protein
MATALSAVDLRVPADQVWKLIGGFGASPDWLPYIPTSELGEGGRTRRFFTSVCEWPAVAVRVGLIALICSITVYGGDPARPQSEAACGL